MITAIGCEIKEPDNGTVDTMMNGEATDQKEDTAKSELSSVETVFATEAETKTSEPEFEYNEYWYELFDYDLFGFQSPERLSLALKNDKKGFDIRPNLINSSDEYITFLNRFEDGATVGIDELVACGIIKKVEAYGLKVLGNGTLEKKLTVKANKFSASAVAKIEAAGGKAEVIE